MTVAERNGVGPILSEADERRIEDSIELTLMVQRAHHTSLSDCIQHALWDLDGSLYPNPAFGITPDDQVRGIETARRLLDLRLAELRDLLAE